MFATVQFMNAAFSSTLHRFYYRRKDFSSSLCVHTGFGTQLDSYTMDTGGKARPGRDADHSPTSSAKVENEYAL
jgi:hypothetical protein